MRGKKKNSSTYEDYSDIIDSELAKRRNNWFLNSVSWIDFDDVSQIIRAHIHRKWDQWDQSRPIKPWLNKIISNQFSSLVSILRVRRNKSSHDYFS